MGDEVTPDRVREWLSGGEQYEVEFKSEAKESLNDRDLVEAVVCLANGRGGVLIVGVEDDGTPTGARPRHEGSRTDPNRVQALIANNTQPPLATTVGAVIVDDIPLLVISVPDASRVIGTARGLYVRRAMGGDGKPTCIPFHAHEMLAHEIDRGTVDYAALPVPGASWDDLDPIEFDRVRRMVSEAGSRGDQVLTELSDREILRAFGLMHEEEQLTTGALLLFGRSAAISQHVPTHEAAFQVLRGLSVEVNDFFTEPLFRLADEIFNRFRSRNSQEELQFGLLQVAVPHYSESAFREAVVNALTHRDYTRRRAVHIQWTDDQLEVSSPGGFPEGVSLDNLLVTQPHPRSRLLTDAFKRTGLVERTGRGIRRMFAEQLRFGRSAPDYGRTTSEQVVAVLPGGPANLAVTRWVLDQEREQQRPLSLPELQVLSELVRQRRATTGELSQVLQLTEAETRNQLTRMVERGWVEARGERKGRTWHLSASVYRALEAPAGYVRIRGFDPLQQEQMILTYVQANGRITRGQAAELCAIGPEQAGRLLRQLVGAGKLQQKGQRRGTHYVLPDNAH